MPFSGVAVIITIPSVALVRVSPSMYRSPAGALHQVDEVQRLALPFGPPLIVALEAKHGMAAGHVLDHYAVKG
jgi:hypothetical protein